LIGWGVNGVYDYKARLIRVIDGDTVVMDIDLGCFVRRETTLRLLGINAPEVVGESRAAGLAASAHLKSLLEGGGLTIHTVLDRNDKYGRLLATIFRPGGVDVNALMVADGHATKIT
jgi:micrococcal nuclease